jgi:hypothetical protein
VTQQDASGDSTPAEITGSQPPEHQTPPSQRAPEGAPWFGYIGLGIALVSMLLGIAAIVFAVFWFIGWTRR